MASKFIDNDPDTGADIEGVDRHFYEKQVPPAGPFHDNAFELAKARAKDKARHQLIRAIQQADRDVRYASFAGFGNDSLLDSISISRSIDGQERAPLNDIKL